MSSSPPSRSGYTVVTPKLTSASATPTNAAVVSTASSTVAIVNGRCVGGGAVGVAVRSVWGEARGRGSTLRVERSAPRASPDPTRTEAAKTAVTNMVTTHQLRSARDGRKPRATPARCSAAARNWRGENARVGGVRRRGERRERAPLGRRACPYPGKSCRAAQQREVQFRPITRQRVHNERHCAGNRPSREISAQGARERWIGGGVTHGSIKHRSQAPRRAPCARRAWRPR